LASAYATSLHPLNPDGRPKKSGDVLLSLPTFLNGPMYPDAPLDQCGSRMSPHLFVTKASCMHPCSYHPEKRLNLESRFLAQNNQSSLVKPKFHVDTRHMTFPNPLDLQGSSPPLSLSRNKGLLSPPSLLPSMVLAHDGLQLDGGFLFDPALLLKRSCQLCPPFVQETSVLHEAKA